MMGTTDCRLEAWADDGDSHQRPWPGPGRFTSRGFGMDKHQLKAGCLRAGG